MPGQCATPPVLGASLGVIYPRVFLAYDISDAIPTLLRPLPMSRSMKGRRPLPAARMKFVMPIFRFLSLTFFFANNYYENPNGIEPSRSP